MAEVTNTVLTIPAYISNDAADDSITVTDPISGTKAVVLATGYYEFQLNDGTGTGTATDPWHILKKLAAATTTKWTYEMGLDGRVTIGYLGIGSATFVFENSHIQNLFGSSSSTLTFSGAGRQTMTYPVFGMFLSKSRKGDTTWRHSPGFSVYQETADSRVIGWNDGNHKHSRRFSFDYLPANQNFKTTGQVSTPARPVDASTLNTTPSALSYTAPYTALRFLKESQGVLMKLHLGALPYNGTDQYYKVYFRPDSIKRANRFPPSINGNERYVTMDEVEVLLSDADSGEASYATGSLDAVIAPSDISGLFAWYKSTAVTSSFGTVSQVQDLTGNGRHAVQATSGSQPLYYSSGGPNNAPYWAGVTNTRYLLAGAANDFNILHNGTNWTIIFIARGSNQGARVIFGTQNASSTDIGFGLFEGASGNNGYAGAIGNGSTAVLTFNQPSAGWTTSSFHKSIITYDNSLTIGAMSSSIDSSTVYGTKTGTPTASNSGRKLGIGSAGSGAFITDTAWCEIMIWNKKLNSTELAQINSYILDTYGL